MTGRTTPALALALLVFGVVVGLLGLADHAHGIWTRAGILLSVASLPPLIIWQSQRAHHVSADNLEATHADGYRLALEHVALGLLDAPPAPPDGGERAGLCTGCADRAAAEQADKQRPSNVLPLFPDRADRTHVNRTKETDDPDHDEQVAT